MLNSPRFYLLLALIAALGCYTIGFGPGGIVFLILGGLCELAFWVGLWRGTRK